MSESSLVNCFLDTNIWLYAFVESQDETKSAVAKQLINDNVFIVSTQVINEVCVNLIKKASFDEDGIRRLIRSFCFEHYVVSVNEESLLKASQLRSAYSFSFWDSIIAASALTAGATLLYSEDMANGLIIESRLTILNPFSVSA
ncbi:MAG: PIN domain-containing protein [Pyrinomonadaceae bacterium]